MTYSVSQLYYHPIKSLGAVSADVMAVDACGPVLDRRLMLVDDNGKFVTQRQSPVMTLIQVQHLNAQLVLSFEGSQFVLDLPDFSEQTRTIQTTVWGDEVVGQFAGKAVSNWISNCINKKVNLVYMQDSEHRQVDLEFANKGVQTGFSDGFPFLLISQASLDFLSEKVGYSLSMKRFRPNIVVSGCAPFAEDNWKTIKIGDITFDLVKPCSRCVIPTINLSTAEKEKEVMQAMLAHRKQGKNVYVGQNLIHNQQGHISLGMNVEIIE